MSEKNELNAMNSKQRKAIEEAVAAGEGVLSDFAEMREHLSDAERKGDLADLAGSVAGDLVGSVVSAAAGAGDTHDAKKMFGYAVDDLRLFRNKLAEVELPDGTSLTNPQFMNLVLYFTDRPAQELLNGRNAAETFRNIDKISAHIQQINDRMRAAAAGVSPTPPKQPQKYTRADALHDQMVRLGEIQEVKPQINKKRFAIKALVFLLIIGVLIGVSYWRIGLLEDLQLRLAGGETVELPFDGEYAPIYRLVRLVLFVLGGGFLFYAVITLIGPKRRKPNRSFWGDLGIYLMLILVAVAMIFPLVFSISSSLKPLDELFRFPPKVFAQHPTLDNFSDLFVTLSQSYVPFSRYLLNTVLITFVGTFGHLVVASMAAFVLAKYDFPGGKTFFSIIVTALMFSGYVTGIPNYVIMSRLHMIDTYWAVILPAFAAPMGLFLMKQFMEGLPTALIEAAHLDGAGEFRIFWSIVMPNVKPAWLTMIIFSVQGLWNTNAATVIYSEAKKTLVYALQQIQAGGIARTGQAAAVQVITMLVPITIFIFSQSRILETMASSGLKD